MAAFKDTTETEFTEKSYLSRLFVYLESEEDRKIIEDRWFYDEAFEFRSSGEDTGGAGGCSMVVKKVKDDEENGIKSVGLVDRDILLKDLNWDLWWETDDEKFKPEQPYGEKIRVLTRWEIENYLLLVPEIVESVKADCFGENVSHPAPVPLSEDEISLLRTLTSADVVCHKSGKSKVSDSMAGFSGSNEDLRKSLKKKSIDLDELDRMVEYAIKFAGEETFGTREYWIKQSRMLNGKVILKRLHLLGGSLSDKNDFRLSLASRIADRNKIDSEIIGYIQEFRKMTL